MSKSKKQRKVNTGKPSRRFSGDSVETAAPKRFAVATPITSLKKTLQEAFALHQQGKLSEAATKYQAVLQADGQHFDALHMLGVIRHQQGHDEEAVDLIKSALKQNPESPVAHYHLGLAFVALKKPLAALASYRRALEIQPNYAEAYHGLGNALKALKRLEEATSNYQRALELKPDHVDSHNNLGNVLGAQGKFTEAVGHFQRALELKPDYAEASNNLGITLSKQGKFTEAVRPFQRALELKPDYAEAHYNLGNALKALKRLEEAVFSYQQALAIKPDYAEASNNLGNVLGAQGKFTEAVGHFQRALELRPDHVEASNNLGITLSKQGRFAEAVRPFQRALELKPDYAAAHHGLGITLREQGKLEEAVAHFQRALELRPDHAETSNNLGAVLLAEGKFAEAVAHFQRALELRPDYADAHWNYAVSLLLHGDFERGWQEYEWRWKWEKFPSLRWEASGSMWDGTSLRGRTVLLNAEQGLGDTIQFIRYARQVQALGGRVVVCVPVVLGRLLAQVAGVDTIVTRREAIPPYDVQAPLMSLPRILGTTLETIPQAVPYLRAEPSLVKQWGARVAALSGVKVGLVWQGRKMHKNDLKRSVVLSRFGPLMKARSVSWVSLQKGEGQEQIGPSGVADRLMDWTADIQDFADTAALIANLDLVITVDTAVAHLAGAMGKPTWVLLPFVPDWRWLLERADSPWYPTMRLFRQTKPGDWEGVVARIQQKLWEEISA